MAPNHIVALMADRPAVTELPLVALSPGINVASCTAEVQG
jgi:hypothetical protein